MNYEAINFGKKFKLFDEQWQPKVIAEMNDYQFKIVKLQGDFVWHDRKNTDETFIILEGTLRIDFRDGAVHVLENVRGSKGRRTQAVCRPRGQIIAYRTARSAQYWR
jgi:mannose-6-phosphate isomerase-like protein (cupin superfamily)